MTDTAAAIKAGLTDRQALGCTLYGEARGETVRGQVAVACVIRNRVKRPGRFGDTYRAVCLRKSQFSCWWAWGGKVNYARTLDAAAALQRHDTLLGPLMARCLRIADAVMAEHQEDITAGADHYCTRELYIHQPPRWTAGIFPVAHIDAHVFFKVP